MNRIINLQPQNYYRQDNNKILPGTACMPTSRVMFYLGNGIEYENPSDLADDDYFMKLLRSDEAWKFAKKKYPSLISAGFAPNEIHGMYHSYLDYEVVGRRTSDFRDDLTFDDYLDRIRGKVADHIGSREILMTSGYFPAAGFNGHAFCIIGAIIPVSGDPSLILADPYGDYRNLYKRGSGYAVVMSKIDFLQHVKPAGSEKKWGHVII